MSITERSWSVHIDGYPVVSTNDLTLDEAAIAEQVSGVPYSMMNPLASVKVAKALLVVLMVRGGVTEDEAIKLASTTPLKKLHNAFRFHVGSTPATSEGETTDPPPSAPTSAIG